MVLDYQSRKAYMQDYYRRNRERLNKQASDYIKNHPEQRKEYRRQRYLHHREEHLKRVKKRQKKFLMWNYIYLAKDNRIKREPYEEEMNAAKSLWEKELIRKKYLKKRDRAARIKLSYTRARLEKEKIKRKERRERRVQKNIDQFLISKNKSNETQKDSTQATD